MSKSRTRKMVQLALLVSAAAVLHVVEAMIPVPLPVPGAKLGLANMVTLAVVLKFGLGEALIVAILRSLLGALLGGTFLTLGFFLSFSGGVASALLMGTMRKLSKESIGALGLSLVGAVTHNITQLVVASIVASHWGLFLYLPVLLFVALPTGYFVGLVGNLIYKSMPQW